MANNSTLWERLYCEPCMTSHWVQVTRQGMEICHGENYNPFGLPGVYVRHVGGGKRYEIIPRRNTPAPLPDVYDQIAAERQDW